MPVCHKNRFIFFHVPRCAGTSIEKQFGLLKPTDLYGVMLSQGQEITLQHLTPIELKRLGMLDDETLDSYFKFTVIRDPFERMASDYAWQKLFDAHQLFNKMSFNQYLDFAERIIAEDRYYEKRHYDHFRPMVSYCLNGNELLVDDILLLENLEQGLARIENKVGMGVRGLPKSNSSRTPVNELRTTVNIDRVYEIYSADKHLYDQVSLLEETPLNVSIEK